MIRSVANARRIAGAALVSLTMLAVFSGCSKKAATTGPVVVVDAITIVSGDQQNRQAGRTLRAPIVLRATDAAGRGVANAAITIVVAQGGGAVDSASIKTNTNGEARIRWTLGPEVGQTLTATVQSVAPLRINATGILPADIIIAQGNGQSAKLGLAVANPIVVRVVGTNNTPMDSINVTVQIVDGGGAMAPASVLTNASGEATVRWTLGPRAGSNTALVRAGALDPVTITATATP
jgi:hypothetical protein